MTYSLTGRGVLLWLGGFFAIIFATNAYFVTMSVKTFRGEDEQLPYLQGINYNHMLAERTEQRALGWKGTVTIVRLPSGSARLQLAIRDAGGRPLEGLVVKGELRHPADENRDRPLAMKAVAPGLYQADIDKIAPGAWDAVLHTEGGAPFEVVQRLWLR